AEYTDTPVCDDESGECVGCLPASEEEDCGDKSCDPATFTCGPHDRESRGVCRSCVSDSDCQTNHRCVQMQYPAGTPREGGYCLRMLPMQPDACEQPYSVALSGRTSLSGVSGSSYCGINENEATCDAVRALTDNWHCDPTTPGDGHCWQSGDTVADAV